MALDWRRTGYLSRKAIFSEVVSFFDTLLPSLFVNSMPSNPISRLSDTSIDSAFDEDRDNGFGLA